MTPHTQLFQHDPANGVYGDCWRTCIAALLDLRPEDVPHFAEGGPDADEFYRRTTDWLATRGLGLASIAFESPLDAVQRHLKQTSPGVYYMLLGRSASGCNHFVVCRDGEIVHDPSITKSGIVGPDSDGCYWVLFLVATPVAKAA